MAVSSKIVTVIILGLLASCVQGCGSTKEASTPTYNYSQYTTYQIGNPAVVSSNSPVFKWPQLSERIHKALNFHLPSVGLDPAQNKPDLIIYYYVITDEDAQRPLLDYQIGWRAEQFLASGERFSEYAANTFVIDIVDAAAGELVWRGSTEIPFDNEQRTYERLSGQIRQLVQRYPALPKDS